ncbi:MAG: VOC family protein [Dehalococcoidia bacterium]|nr:VOC family protein [Dehalococcoidia bacterium]
MGIGAKYIDHIVVASNDSAATAKVFSEHLGIEIKRVMSRPGTGAHLEFAKLGEIVLEFAGPREPKDGEEPKARLGGFVLAVEDIDAAVAELRAKGVDVGDPHPAVQPGAKLAGIRSGTNGVPLAMIQYNALPVAQE